MATGVADFEAAVKDHLKRLDSLLAIFVVIFHILLVVESGEIELFSLRLGRGVALRKQTAGKKKAGAVGSGIVGEAGLDSVPGELVAVRSAQSLVVVEGGEDNLRGHSLVAETNDE